MPLFRPVERRNIYSSLQIGSADLHYLGKRALYSVKNRADKPRSQLNAQWLSGGHHFFARSQSRGLLINLNRRPIAVHFYYLAYKVLIRDTHHVEHIGVSHALRYYERTRDLYYRSFGHYDFSFYRRFIPAILI